MLRPGLANLFSAAFRARGVCRTFAVDFGSLLKKLLFLGLTPLLQLWLLGRHVRRRLGRRLARRWLVETAWAPWEARSQAWAASQGRSDAAWDACQAKVVRLISLLVGWLHGWLVGW